MAAQVKPNMYKAVWLWSEDVGLTFKPTEKETTKRTFYASGRDLTGERRLRFVENVDLVQQKVFKALYQRVVTSDMPAVVTLQDVKDVVTFLVVGPVPTDVLALLHCAEINRMFRALIVYFQLYLQVWEDLNYRRIAYTNQRLKHPSSIKRESHCRVALSKLRSLVGQEYARIICGEGVYRKYHHMNNPINSSYSSKDMILYDYLFSFSARLVWITLLRSNFKEIELELSHMFAFKINHKLHRDNVSRDDDRVLHGENVQSQNQWRRNSPVVSDLFVNQNDSDLLVPKGTEDIFNDELSGLDACIDLPEEVLQHFGLTVGILGQDRENFEAMLHPKQPPKNLEEQEMEKALGKVEAVEKPSVKMYFYLSQLETPVQLQKPGSDKSSLEDTRCEIQHYLQMHAEEGRRASLLWRDTKGCSLTSSQFG